MARITGVTLPTYEKLEQESPVVYHMHYKDTGDMIIVHASYLVKKLNGNKKPTIKLDRQCKTHYM